MTTKNAILLILKQHDGITLSELFNKIAPNYSNHNSARAALSRAIKYFSALDFVSRTGNNIFLTSKGLLEINKEMENKLLLKLNELILEDGRKDVDEIVAKLSVLLEKSKQDADLLKVAKNSSKFFLSDLKSIHTNLVKETAHLQYLQGILSQQINALKELDFKDVLVFSWRENPVQKIIELIEHEKPPQLLVECLPEFVPVIQHNVGGERQKDFLVIEREKCRQLLEFLQNELLKEQELQIMVSIIFSNITITLKKNEIKIIGPQSLISKVFHKTE